MADERVARERIIASLARRLEAEPFVHAFWEAGAAAWGRVDAWSDLDLYVVSFGAGLDCKPRWIGMLKIQGYFQLHLSEKKVLHNTDDPLYGRITTGGEVYNVGFSATIQL